MKVHVNGQRENCLMDTGADASILPMFTRSKAEKRSSVRLCTASGQSLSNSGTRECTVDVGNFQVAHKFYVAEVKKPILGFDFLKQHELELNVKPNGKAKLSGIGKGHPVDTCTGKGTPVKKKTFG